RRALPVTEFSAILPSEQPEQRAVWIVVLEVSFPKMGKIHGTEMGSGFQKRRFTQSASPRA
ncbi:MAG TPA: hypothetical protein VH858_01400, partial [Hyphomicrobiales bacterium]